MKAVVVVIVACLAVLALAAEEPLVRVAHYEPVQDFSINDHKDALSFRAYGHLWSFSIWLSEVAEEDGENEHHYHGRMDNVPSSFASFTVMSDYITGMIILGNETYWLEAKDPATPLDLYMYKTSDVWFHPSVATLHCSHAGEQRSHEEPEMNSVDKRGAKSVAVYTDQYWRSSAKNPSWYTSGATLGLLNDVNAVYASAGLSGFSFRVVGGRNNRWTTQSALNTMLSDFSTWSSTAVSASFNMVAWLVGNNIGGLAWLGSACGAYGKYYRTSVSGLANWSRLWTVKTIAHEMGHNRGATHDFGNQCASTQSSGCQCSVMSYCFPSSQTAGGAVNYFSRRSINEIRATCN